MMKNIFIGIATLLLAQSLTHALEAPFILTISIRPGSNGVVYLCGDKPSTRQEVSAALARLASIDKNAKVAVRPSADTSFQVVADVLREIKSHGLTSGAIIYEGPDLNRTNATALAILPIAFSNFFADSYSNASIMNDIKNAQPAGPGYPPQGVGSPDP